MSALLSQKSSHAAPVVAAICMFTLEAARKREALEKQEQEVNQHVAKIQSVEKKSLNKTREQTKLTRHLMKVTLFHNNCSCFNRYQMFNSLMIYLQNFYLQIQSVFIYIAIDPIRYEC